MACLNHFIAIGNDQEGDISIKSNCEKESKFETQNEMKYNETVFAVIFSLYFYYFFLL